MVTERWGQDKRLIQGVPTMAIMKCEPITGVGRAPAGSRADPLMDIIFVSGAPP